MSVNATNHSPRGQNGLGPSFNKQNYGKTKVVYSKAVMSGQGTISPRGGLYSPPESRSPFKAHKYSADMSVHQGGSINEDISVFLKPKIHDKENNMNKANRNRQLIDNQSQLLSQLKAEEPLFDLRQFRLVATDFLMSPILQNLFAKLWKLMLNYNYEKSQIQKNQELLLQIPLKLSVYAHFDALFSRGLGALYQTSQFICSHATHYPHDYLLFNRFCFDFLSLSGTFLYQLTLSQYEYLFRKVFSLITYYDDQQRELCFRNIDDIGFQVDQQQIGNNLITQEMVIDVLTTKWSRRKKQIKEEYEAQLAVELEQQKIMKEQIDKVPDNEGEQNPNFDSLIDLSAIAEKAREEELKKEERRKLGSSGRRKIRQFMIYGELKEDLHIILKKDVAGTQQLIDPIDQLLSQAKQSTSPQQLNSKVHHNIPEAAPMKSNKPVKRTLNFAQYIVPPPPQHLVEKTLKSMLLYKQFVAISKNKDESDDEQEKTNQNVIANPRSLQRVQTPQLKDSSDSDESETARKWKESMAIKEEPVIKNNARGRTQESENLNEGSKDESNHNGENEQFVKYVWNKKTKRLEKRDMRQAANFDNIDKRKFDNFSKVNERSKILCMQLQENYFNSTLLPTAIAGEGDVNFKEIQEEQLYGPNDSKNQTQQFPSPMKPVKNEYTIMPQYQRHLLDTTVQAQMKPSTNMKNKRRRQTQEDASKIDNYGIVSSKGTLQGDVRVGTEKLASLPNYKSGEPDFLEQQNLVDKRLDQIRTALRGQQQNNQNNGLIIKERGQYDQLSKLTDTTIENDDFNNQGIVATAAMFNRNQKFFAEADQKRMMNGTATTQIYHYGGRASSLLETRDLFMRSKLQAMQQTNKRHILSQRDKLKSSMQKTNFSFNETGAVMLPQLEAVAAPRTFKQIPPQIRPAKQASPANNSGIGLANRGLNRSNQNYQSGQQPLKNNGNIQVKLKINASPTPQKPYKSVKSSYNKHHLDGGGFQSSPRSSNNNLDIIEYGVLTLNQKDLIRIQNQQQIQDPTFTSRDYDAVVITGEEIINQQSQHDDNMNIKQSIQEISIEERIPKQKPFISPLNLAAVKNNIEQQKTKSQTQQKFMASTQNRMQGSREIQKQSPFRKNEMNEEPEMNDPLLMTNQSRQKLVNSTLNSIQQDMRSSKQSADRQFTEKRAFINQLPMQDFQLESWKKAYKNINSATRHFYTGSSFPVLKI